MAALIPWIATQYAPHRHHSSPNYAILFDCLQAVLGTARVKTAETVRIEAFQRAMIKGKGLLVSSYSLDG
jgi:hypothetical protein